ncbi:unnamed protein product [Arabidopsis lyrata]|nr:unnamed protein product [Arabidopsis lyrata]
MSDRRYRHHEGDDPCRATLQQLHLRTYIRTIDRRKASICEEENGKAIEEPMTKIWGFNTFDGSYSDALPQDEDEFEFRHESREPG